MTQSLLKFLISTKYFLFWLRHFIIVKETFYNDGYLTEKRNIILKDTTYNIVEIFMHL